jgi:hypothetical protein
LGKKSLQVGGTVYGWRSPDGRFTRAFLKIDQSCDQFPRPAVLIVADINDEQAHLTSVDNLAKQLPALLSARGEACNAYSLHEPDEARRTRILVELTEHPVFVG